MVGFYDKIFYLKHHLEKDVVCICMQNYSNAFWIFYYDV